MAIPIYLAMTAEEFAICGEKPPHIAWMACHFSPYGKGLTNLPPILPKDAIVTVNDRIPWQGHDPKRICEQLLRIRCGGFLLDFQRDDTPKEMVQYLIASLPHPICVSAKGSVGVDSAVLAPPCPPHIPLADHLKPWKGREIWLEAALNTSALRITPNGAMEIPTPQSISCRHTAPLLACHYGIRVSKERADFLLLRIRNDLTELAGQAKPLGVTRMVGLYQELK